MKTPHLYLLFCIAFCLLALSSCEVKDNTPCTPRHKYHPLTAEEKSKTPYFTNPDFDTIRFASNTGDTLVFALQSIDSSWYIEDDNRNPEGCPNLQYYENRSIRYKSLMTIDFITISQSIKSFDYTQPYIIVAFNYTHFFMWADWIGWSGYTNYIDEYFYNNRTYKASILKYADSEDTTSSSIIYNKDYGAYSIFIKEQNKTYHLIYP